MRKFADSFLNVLIRFSYEKLHLTPNEISTIGFITGVIAATLVTTRSIGIGMCVLAISQIIDGIDGGVARRYNLQSSKGQMLEILYDRSNELMMFLALTTIGEVSLRMSLLAFVAILLITAIEPKSKFDPGFKRFVLYFGYIATVLFSLRGFEIAMHIIFFANLFGFIIGTILVDYRLQKEIDTQAIMRRNTELALRIPQPPDDPPTLLSKLFSWL